MALQVSRGFLADAAVVPVPVVAFLCAGSVAVGVACFHLEYLFPFAFAGVRVQTVQGADGKVIEASEAMPWVKGNLGHGKMLLKDLYPKSGVPEWQQSTIEFMLYKTTGHTNSRVGRRRRCGGACSRATFPRDARASATLLLYTTCAGRVAANV